MLELYFIMRRITYFNYQSNYFLSEGFGLEEYSKRRDVNRRKVWKTEEIEAALSQNEIELEPMISLKEFCIIVSKGWKDGLKISFLNEFMINKLEKEWGNEEETKYPNGSSNQEKELFLEESREKSLMKKVDEEYFLPVDEIIYFNKDEFTAIYEANKEK